MSTWRSAAQWRPPQFGWSVPVEFPSFLSWLAPCAAGALLLAVDKIATGSLPPWPQRLDQIGLFGGYTAATLLCSPLWGFPAILVAFPVRWLLLSNGWFGWASALVAGAFAGLAVPLLLGQGLWLEGPLYGAIYLSMQSLIYGTRGADDFCKQE